MKLECQKETDTDIWGKKFLDRENSTYSTTMET